MSQRNPGAPRGGSSYTPRRRQTAAAPRRRGPGGTTIAIAAMAVLLAVILGAGWWLNQNPATPDAPTIAPTVSVWDHASATLSAISVQNMTTTTSVRFEDGRWRVTEPVQDVAGDLQVESAGNSLKTLVAQSRVAENADNLEQFGLASPSLTVTVVLSGATPPDQRLFVGNANVDGSAYYVKSATAPAVYLVSNGTIEPLRSWLETPPVAPPTSTPFPSAVITVGPTITASGTLTATGAATSTVAIPTTAVITDTNTVATTVPLVVSPTTQMPPEGAPPGTAVVTGTQPLPGMSPVSSPPAGSPQPSPGAGGDGAGPGGVTTTVETPTP